MKQTFLGLLLTLSLFSCDSSPKTATTNPKVDAKKGYKDLVLDAPLTTLNKKGGMELEEDDQCKSIKKFHLTDNTYLRIGGVQFDKVEVTFVLDSLSGTTLFSRLGHSHLADIRNIYSQELGQPTNVETKNIGNDELTKLDWKGDSITITIQSSIPSGMIISYHSTKGLDREFDQQRKCQERKTQQGRKEI